MPTPFSMTRDINGYNGFGLAFSLDKYSATITTGVDTTVTVPSGGPLGSGTSTTTTHRYLAIFSYEPGSNVWVSVNATAAVPAGGTFAATTSELLPTARYVTSGDILHFITGDTTADVGVTFYVLL